MSISMLRNALKGYCLQRKLPDPPALRIFLLHPATDESFFAKRNNHRRSCNQPNRYPKSTKNSIVSTTIYAFIVYLDELGTFVDRRVTVTRDQSRSAFQSTTTKTIEVKNPTNSGKNV